MRVQPGKVLLIVLLEGIADPGRASRDSDSVRTMAFFGTTCLGDYQSLLKSQTTSHANAFCGISEEAYENAFDEFVLGASTQSNLEARSLKVDGQHCILRENLIGVLKHVLGRRATKQEFDTFFKHFDFDSDCVMSRQEFRRAYSSLMHFAAIDEEQREWYSYSLKHTDWLRHKRLRCSPQETLTSELTESQRVGCASGIVLHTKHLLHDAQTRVSGLVVAAVSLVLDPYWRLLHVGTAHCPTAS